MSFSDESAGEADFSRVWEDNDLESVDNIIFTSKSSEFI